MRELPGYEARSSLHDAALNLRDRGAVAAVESALKRCRERRALPSSDFEDLAQTVLVKLFKKSEQRTLVFESAEERAVHSYLCTMLRNARVDALRRAGATPVVAHEAAVDTVSVEADEGGEHYLGQLEEQFRRVDKLVTAGGTNAQRDVFAQIAALDAGEKTSVVDFLPPDLTPAELKKRRDQLLTQHKRWRQGMLEQIAALRGKGEFDAEVSSQLERMVLRLRQRGLRNAC